MLMVHAALAASMLAGATSVAAAAAPAKPPHILLIVSDDLGWNDVSFHGSPQIGTPHIDALAAEGVALYNWHVQPVCSPTRATLMSGRHVIHTGIYSPFGGGKSFRLGLNFTLLPAYLKKLSYSTHMVGKWHLGDNELAALPTGRGFDTYFGYWNGAEDYYTHEVKGGYDFEDDVVTAEGKQDCRTAWEYRGGKADANYSTFVFTEKAVAVIEGAAKKGAPMFLYLAYQNVHWPLQAPPQYLAMYADKVGNASSKDGGARQHVCAMAKVMDDGIGNVTRALKAAGMYDDTIIWFSSDNGGPTNGNEGTWSDNFPLRGGKNTIWEGGTRLASVVRGPGIANPGSISFEMIHGTDLLPTLVTVASGGQDWRQFIPAGEPAHQLGDGINQWGMLSKGTPSARTEMILECHKEDAPANDTHHGNALIVGHMKIIRMASQNNEPGWYVPPGEDFDTTQYTLQKFGCGTPPTFDPDQMKWPSCTAKNGSYCLFNVTADPCEYHNIADKHPDIVTKLVTRLKDYQATAVPSVVAVGCDPVLDKSGAWRPCDDPTLDPAEHQPTRPGDGWSRSGQDAHGTRIEY